MTSPAPSVGFVTEGMTGPGSGVWTRFAALVRGLSAAGIQVHALAAPGQEETLSVLPLTSIEELSYRSRARRMLSRRRTAEAFVRDCHLETVYLETPPFTQVSGAASIATIHDLRGFHGSAGAPLSWEVAYQRFGLKRQIGNMTGIAVPSTWGAQEVVTRLGIPDERVHVIPPIVDGPPAAPVDREPMPDGPFALVLGHLEPRKNIATVIRATASPAWPPGLDLVIAGRDAGSGHGLKELASSPGHRATFLGPVSEPMKWSLLRHAEIVLLPSTIEGFGFVAVEAPLAGTPALVADAAALPDLAATDLAQLPPLDPDAWADRIRLITEDPALGRSIVVAQALNARQFTAASVIARVLAMHDAIRGR